MLFPLVGEGTAGWHLGEVTLHLFGDKVGPIIIMMWDIILIIVGLAWLIMGLMALIKISDVIKKSCH